ncbi:hypothetical protein OAU50_03475 [Planctomycetota bacterium]|nr:hypothetical protein [Planctomycetota bacterium]
MELEMRSQKTNILLAVFGVFVLLVAVFLVVGDPGDLDILGTSDAAKGESNEAAAKRRDSEFVGNREETTNRSERLTSDNSAATNRDLSGESSQSNPEKVNVASVSTRSPLVHVLVEWDESLEPTTLLAPKSIENGHGKQPFSDGLFTPIFVDKSSLRNVQIHGTLQADRRMDYKEYPLKDGALRLNVAVRPYTECVVSKVQVMKVGTKQAWEYEWRDKIQGNRTMFVPYKYGDLLLVRAHLTSGKVVEGYVSTMVMSFLRSGSYQVRVSNNIALPYSSKTPEGGTFSVVSVNGDSVSGTVLMNWSCQVLGRVNADGVLAWNKLEIGWKVKESPSVGYPAVLWKPGHIPIRFDKDLPVVGAVNLGAKTLAVSIDVPGIDTLSDAEKSIRNLRSPGRYYESDLIPLATDAEVPQSSDISKLIGYTDGDDSLERRRLRFKVWKETPFFKNKHSLNVPSYPGNSSAQLGQWFCCRWQIDDNNKLHVELPVAGKYLLSIGSKEDVPTDDELYGSATHFVYIDATDPTDPSATLIDRPVVVD